MTPYLEKRYNKSLKIDTIKEKDIIYFCRDSLSNSISEEDKKKYEKEILSIIKVKEWDWFVQDIDKNNILTYPIYNNAFNIVKYLLENNKYNLKKYDKVISNSLSACIMLTGEKMQRYILSQEIDNQYITDMAFKAYIMSINVMPQYKNEYIKKAQELINLNADFDKILVNFLKENEFPKLKDTFYQFLEEHPMTIQEKVKAVVHIVEKLEENKNSIKFSEKYTSLKKWLQYHELNEKLITKKIKVIKKSKI